MTIYKWRCPYCGTCSGSYGNREQAIKEKEIHVNWCGQPHIWTAKEKSNLPQDKELIEVWV